MAQKPPQSPPPQQLILKDPVLAGFLAWLLPGAGHFYQGRYAKGVLYLVCILGTFVYGLYLSSRRTTGPARVVYFSFRSGDLRLAYLCQVGAGLPALPALVQADGACPTGKEPLWNGFMAPPRLETVQSDKPAHPHPGRFELRSEPLFRAGHGVYHDRRAAQCPGHIRRLLRPGLDEPAGKKEDEEEENAAEAADKEAADEQ